MLIYPITYLNANHNWSPNFVITFIWSLANFYINTIQVVLFHIFIVLMDIWRGSCENKLPLVGFGAGGLKLLDLIKFK